MSFYRVSLNNGTNTLVRATNKSTAYLHAVDRYPANAKPLSVNITKVG